MPSRKRAPLGALVLILSLSTSVHTFSQPGDKPAVWSGLRYRMIGPERGGRVTAVTGVPSDPMTFYMGSTDGGKTWSNVLHISDELGAADIELQPGHPDVIFATIWHGLRKPWTIISGSTDGGIYKSTDGGDHWTKLSNGLPHELFGRANIAISAASPDRIYALIEAKPGSGLYRSEDGGSSWTLANGARNLTTRPF